MVVVTVLSLFFLVFLSELEGRNIKNTPMEEEEEEANQPTDNKSQPQNVFGGIGSVMLGPGGTSAGSGVGVILPGTSPGTMGNIGSPFNIGSVLPGTQLPVPGGSTALPIPIGGSFPGMFGSVPIPGGGQIIGGVFGDNKKRP